MHVKTTVWLGRAVSLKVYRLYKSQRFTYILDWNEHPDLTYPADKKY